MTAFDAAAAAATAAATQVLVEMGRAWLAHAPGPGQTAPGLAGWQGPVGFVCVTCASRILRRGCDLNALAQTPVWEGPVEGCALCSGTGSGAMPPEGEMA